MIEKQYTTFYLICDMCDKSADEEFDCFEDAVDYKKDNGWKSRMIKGEWHDVCPDCLKKK